MVAPPEPEAAGQTADRRLFVYNGGFLTQPRIRRILELSGYRIKLGAPGPEDLVGVWGMSPTAHRGEAIAQRAGKGLVRVEDAWLRSLHPGRMKEPPLGLLIDHGGVHYDPATASDLETLLATHPLDDTALLDTARGLMARIQEAHLTKFSAVDPARPAPPPGYVLVLDQTRGDASVTACGADRNRFLEMLFVAQEEHPGAPIVIKSHPESVAGFRPGYFEAQDLSARITLLTDPVSPWVLFEGAVGVYTVSSQLGFEAIFAGHKPRVFGQPFYAGWGLSQDEFPVQRRQRKLTRAQLFAAAMMLYPKWYDPYRDQLCEPSKVVETLAAQARSWRDDHRGWVASGMRLWKRKPLQQVFGMHRPVIFEDDPEKARALDRPWMVWAAKAQSAQSDAVRVEDGFLRSRGLGADLVPPLSLVLDDLGIYYDPTRPSRLEALIDQRSELRPDQEARAQALVTRLVQERLTKYNLGGEPAALPDGHRILVVGQVEDDASVTTGTTEVRSNLALLQAARAAHPTATLIYKPHPDVEAGLRDGACDATGLADYVADRADPLALVDQVQAVWTMTSLLGFEALLRQVPVTTLGAPFYAGWGLTRDLGEVPPRRRARPTLAGLVHAALIDYPRYIDPKTGLPCPVEVVVDRLASGHVQRRTATNRLLAKLQGLLAGHTGLWRR
ncbi:capsular polysaccharide biosynthesis protein [Roseobacter sinensis]|uniref:Capsular polysaccharide biosynthesis protein n=1 Tax=Roseobacter sinensis TaxID=2931391 RepID=A0ABT3BHG0_9RHOB|nr:capsular polysaccharide biosynthesis protein [Roseobacter sp. WL0113]MCV3272618.1 capsular polysaccharide biosynthesis protein [Roseobacter sp. WL0113]